LIFRLDVLAIEEWDAEISQLFYVALSVLLSSELFLFCECGGSDIQGIYV
jgi:hypothetical protein